MTISISKLEALREKMTPGEYSLDGDGGMLGDQANADGPLVMACFNDECMSGDVPGLCAEHNAIPALLALARAVVELERAKDESTDAHLEWTNASDAAGSVWSAARDRVSLADSRVAECRSAYDAARAAVTL